MKLVKNIIMLMATGDDDDISFDELVDAFEATR